MPTTDYRLRDRHHPPVRAANVAGTLKEMFGTGTAAVISPMGELSLGGESVLINEGKTGPIAITLLRAHQRHSARHQARPP